MVIVVWLPRRVIVVWLPRRVIVVWLPRWVIVVWLPRRVIVVWLHRRFSPVGAVYHRQGCKPLLRRRGNRNPVGVTLYQILLVILYVVVFEECYVFFSEGPMPVVLGLVVDVFFGLVEQCRAYGECSISLLPFEGLVFRTL